MIDILTIKVSKSFKGTMSSRNMEILRFTVVAMFKQCQEGSSFTYTNYTFFCQIQSYNNITLLDPPTPPPTPQV